MAIEEQSIYIDAAPALVYGILTDARFAREIWDADEFYPGENWPEENSIAWSRNRFGPFPVRLKYIVRRRKPPTKLVLQVSGIINDVMFYMLRETQPGCTKLTLLLEHEVPDGLLGEFIRQGIADNTISAYLGTALARIKAIAESGRAL